MCECGTRGSVGTICEGTAGVDGVEVKARFAQASSAGIGSLAARTMLAEALVVGRGGLSDGKYVAWLVERARRDAHPLS